MPRFRNARYLTVALLTVLASVTVISSASATVGGQTHVIDERCSFVYGICWSIDAEGGDTYAVMQSEEHGGQFQVCVSPPRGKRVCRPIRLHHRPSGPHGYVGFANRVDLQKLFGLTIKGEYRVTWLSYPGGLPLAPSLYFVLPTTT